MIGLVINSYLVLRGYLNWFWNFLFQERKQLLDMMDQEHQTELNEEEFLLKLEQDEETENLRKVHVLKHNDIIT